MRIPLIVAQILQQYADLGYLILKSVNRGADHYVEFGVHLVFLFCYRNTISVFSQYICSFVNIHFFDIIKSFHPEQLFNSFKSCILCSSSFIDRFKRRPIVDNIFFYFSSTFHCGCFKHNYTI